MTNEYHDEPRQPDESEIGHQVRNLCGYLVHLVCDIDPTSEFGHLVHDLEVADERLKQAR